VWADPARVDEVLSNLLDNALKFSPADRPVTVTVRLVAGAAARGRARRHAQAVTTRPPPPAAVEICVTDQGEGIPAVELPQLFKRFVRLSPQRHAGVQGLGIGLYLTKVLVEQHGGRIWARSQVGAGSTFCFTLPLADTPPPAARPAAAGQAA
jgi:signal transduction histidine kinase